jgi:homopolymeric O-antigen transport system permease protein
MSPVPPTTLRARVSRAWQVLAAMTIGSIRIDRDFTLTGVLKWVIEPAINTATYFVLIKVVLHNGQANYLLVLLCALLPFRYFSGVVGSSLSLVSSHSSVLVNRSFPRSILPLAQLGAEGLPFLISLVFLLPVMLTYQIAPTWKLLWIPVIVGILGVLTAGLSYLGTVFGLYFPDFRAAVQNLLRVSFFLSTGLVKLQKVKGDNLPDLLDGNPLSGIFDSMRSVVIRGRNPAARDLLYPLVVGVILLVVGVIVYRWREPHFAKEV